MRNDLQVDCILLARPTKRRIYFSQMVRLILRTVTDPPQIGRGMRLSPGTGKSGCMIVDFFGVMAHFGAFGVEPCLT